jgi:hypothetical protein
MRWVVLDRGDRAKPRRKQDRAYKKRNLPGTVLETVLRKWLHRHCFGLGRLAGLCGGDMDRIDRPPSLRTRQPHPTRVLRGMHLGDCGADRTWSSNEQGGGVSELASHL